MTADNLVEEQQKQRGRPFVKGQSGNPAGRPRRPRMGSTIAVQLAIEGAAEALGRKAVELALGGDAAALRLCLDRLMPSRRDRVGTARLTVGPRRRRCHWRDGDNHRGSGARQNLASRRGRSGEAG